jgi:hypothetical protein
MAPTGLKCYNNTFVLASDPVCTGPSDIQNFPILVTTQDWSVLTQYGLASALSAALMQIGTQIQPTAIYFASSAGRRLAAQQLMSIRSPYKNLSAALAVAVDRLPAILAANNIAVNVSLQPVSPSHLPSHAAPSLVSGIVANSISIVTCVVFSVISVIMI